jgi:hypothetical protein
MMFGVILASCGGAAPAASTPLATASMPVPSASPLSTPTPSSSPKGTISGRFDIGGRLLFLECRGTGSTSVIFLQGTGAPRTSMSAIEDELLERTVRVCDYDRAGEGESDPAPTRQSDIDVTDDLAALLAAAHVPPPYVLVGQSVGGDQAWLYASKHPAGVAGFLIMNAGFFLLDWGKLKSVWTDAEIAEERAGSDAGLGKIKQAASPPKDVPYVVVMSTIAQCASPKDICGRIYPYYEDWARVLAKRTPNGRFVQVAAGHEIFDARPDFVVAEIGKLLDELR